MYMGQNSSPHDRKHLGQCAVCSAFTGRSQVCLLVLWLCLKQTKKTIPDKNIERKNTHRFVTAQARNVPDDTDH